MCNLLNQSGDLSDQRIKGQAVMNISGRELVMNAGYLMYIPALMPHGSEIIGNETLQLISIFAPPFDGKDRIYV